MIIKMERKIASYQEKGIRLQLVELFDYNKQWVSCYKIIKNRKILCTFMWESPARQKFLRIIQNELLQTSINYEEQ